MRKKILLGAALSLVLLIFLVIFLDRRNLHVFVGVVGPDGPTVVPAEGATPWQTYGEGSPSRLAILLTDVDSAWLGLAHGLKTIGVPFRITRDYKEALQHRVVLVYPLVSGRVLPVEAFPALAAHTRKGGTVIAVNALGGGLQEMFGFHEALPSKRHFELRFAPELARRFTLTDPHEVVLQLGTREKSAETFGTYGYTDPSEPPVAVYEDGQAAITQRTVGRGKTYAMGIDLGAFLHMGYSAREEGVARSYANTFEPVLDVLLRLLRQLYLEGQAEAVTLGTVPFNRALSVLLTHDIDFTQSVPNAVAYAEYEHSQGLSATYFIQTKYLRDYNDDIFFNDQQLPALQHLAALGMELGSHTVSHSLVFNNFPLGTGQEQYPSYRPFVKDRTTAYYGTILGELRVSKFLLDHLIDHPLVLSFRPGELSNPYALPQALQATGYRFSSSVTANNSLTHLPFQLTYDRAARAEVPIFEFPITIEDEEAPPMGERLPQALALVRQLATYGGVCVILIHPNILDHKLAFERGFVEAVKDQAWFGSVAQFGGWWSARNQVAVDVKRKGRDVEVRLQAPQKIAGLTLQTPRAWRLQASEPRLFLVTQDPAVVVLPEVEGSVSLTFRTR